MNQDKSTTAKSSKKPAYSNEIDQTNVDFSAEDKTAMKERAKELKNAARSSRVDGESEVLAKIGEMPEPDRSMAIRLHMIIKTAAPHISAKLWYGMPAYAIDGNVVCFFQSGQKFKTRYSTLGFSDKAKLDEGNLWPVAFALTELSEIVEAKIIALVQQASR